MNNLRNVTVDALLPTFDAEDPTLGEFEIVDSIFTAKIAVKLKTFS